MWVSATVEFETYAAVVRFVTQRAHVCICMFGVGRDGGWLAGNELGALDDSAALRGVRHCEEASAEVAI